MCVMQSEYEEDRDEREKGTQNSCTGTRPGRVIVNRRLAAANLRLGRLRRAPRARISHYLNVHKGSWPHGLCLLSRLPPSWGGGSATTSGRARSRGAAE